MEYRVKDLLDAFDEGEVDILGQQCNCFCMMGAGIAPLIAKRFPEAKEVDDATIAGDPGKLGNFTSSQAVRSTDLLGMVVNFYGQYAGGTTPDILDISVGKTVFNGLGRYEPLRHALRAFNFGLTPTPYTDHMRLSIGLPKMGAGIAGGDWNVIEQIIEEELTNVDVTIYVLNHDELPIGIEGNS
jgi:O-acetyl-ADP-ribose deacetylase (regulator of RNase III)